MNSTNKLSFNSRECPTFILYLMVKPSWGCWCDCLFTYSAFGWRICSNLCCCRISVRHYDRSLPFNDCMTPLDSDGWFICPKLCCRSSVKLYDQSVLFNDCMTPLVFDDCESLNFKKHDDLCCQISNSSRQPALLRSSSKKPHFLSANDEYK